jgi:hypothetical protein
MGNLNCSLPSFDNTMVDLFYTSSSDTEIDKVNKDCVSSPLLSEYIKVDTITQSNTEYKYTKYKDNEYKYLDDYIIENEEVFYDDKELDQMLSQNKTFIDNIEFLSNCMYINNDYKINKEHKILQCKKYINNYRWYVLNKYSYNTMEYNSEFIYMLNNIVIDIKHNIAVYNKYPKWIKKLIY